MQARGAVKLIAGLTAAAFLVAAPAAHAQWGDHRWRDHGGGGRGGWAGPRGGGAGGGRWDGGRPAGGYARGFADRGGYAPRSTGGGYGYRGPEFAPAPQLLRPNQAWRRGQVLPGPYRDARVPDPGRYHLRNAPNGFDWVGDGRDAYLMQRSTGLVLDSVPEAYAPPRRGGRPRR